MSVKSWSKFIENKNNLDGATIREVIEMTEDILSELKDIEPGCEISIRCNGMSEYSINTMGEYLYNACNNEIAHWVAIAIYSPVIPDGWESTMRRLIKYYESEELITEDIEKMSWTEVFKNKYNLSVLFR